MQHDRQHDLEYQYRKLERGIRIMMYHKRRGKCPDIKLEQKIAALTKVYKELGRKPQLPRWPL